MIAFKAPALLVLCVLATVTAYADDWALAKNEDGIQVYLRDVPGSKYKAYRGVATLTTNMAALRAAQENVEGSCAWIHACAEQHLIKHEGAESWVYTRFDMPWPVTSRDAVMHVVSEAGSDGSLLRKLEAQPQFLPLKPDNVRVASVQGYWRFVPKGAGQIEVTYQAHTEPGGSVPSWLANRFVVDAPFNTLQGLRRVVERP